LSAFAIAPGEGPNKTLERRDEMAGVPETLIKTLMEEFKSIARTETIVGHEIQVGGFTLIPISRVSMGLGAGGGAAGASGKGEVKGESGGGGGGIRVDPVAVVVVREGEISVHGIKKGGTLEAILDKIPDLAGNIGRRRKQGAEEKTGE
jgi:uncharacterized spore protein YtfJ